MTDVAACDRLYALLLGEWKPRRASRMTGRAEPKYLDIADYSFTPAHLADHLAGRETYAITLGLLGEARAGIKDYDSADEAEILAALAAAAAKGITAAAFLMTDAAGGHTGGHIVAIFDAPYLERDIRAKLRTIPRKGSGEDYPSGNPIRIPFGYHKVKKTRGILVLQDGRRFALDTDLAAAIDAFLALPLNGKPEPAPLGDARNDGGQAWGDAYKPEEWKNLPDGGPLWRSPYIKAAAERRSDLAKLLRGERVTLVKDDTRDDTDSAQVAALAWNLSSAYVDRQQARAIADYLKPQLRPDKTLVHYRAHFDAEWERYCPKNYQPRTIRILGPADGEEPQALPPAEHKPAPKSRARKDRPQKVAGAAGYLEWLRGQIDPQSGSVMLSQAQCAERLGCCVRTIKRYEKQLGDAIERRVFAQRQAGCLFILAPDVVTTSAGDVVIADPAPAQQHAENAAPATMQVEHPAPLVPAPEAPPLPYLVRQAIRDIEAPAVDTTTGEIRRLARATPDRIRAHITARWPAVDTTDIEELYPEIRKALQAEQKRAKERAYWSEQRRQAGAFNDDQLLAALGGWASKLARAEGKCPGSGYARKCAAHFAIFDDERRRRGLTADAPTDRAGRKAATARTIAVAQALHRAPERPEAPMQAAFVNLVEDVAWLPALEGSRAGGCSTPPAPAGAPPQVETIYHPGYVPEMIARLKARPPAARAQAGAP